MPLSREGGARGRRSRSDQPSHNQHGWSQTNPSAHHGVHQRRQCPSFVITTRLRILCLGSSPLTLSLQWFWFLFPLIFFLETLSTNPKELVLRSSPDASSARGDLQLPHCREKKWHNGGVSGPSLGVPIASPEVDKGAPVQSWHRHGRRQA